MKSIRIKAGDGSVLFESASLADNFFTRFRGLMYRRSIPDDWGLLIVPCNQIHMFNMKFPLDVVYISDDNRVVKTDRNVPVGVVCKTVKGARKVLEINTGGIDRLGLREGDLLTIESLPAKAEV